MWELLQLAAGQWASRDRQFWVKGVFKALGNSRSEIAGRSKPFRVISGVIQLRDDERYSGKGSGGQARSYGVTI
jgi:hypothetical protein